MPEFLSPLNTDTCRNIIFVTKLHDIGTGVDVWKNLLELISSKFSCSCCITSIKYAGSTVAYFALWPCIIMFPQTNTLKGLLTLTVKSDK